MLILCSIQGVHVQVEVGETIFVDETVNANGNRIIKQ